MKKFIGLVVFFMGILMAKEISLMTPNLWYSTDKSAKLHQQDNIITVSGCRAIHCSKKIICNPENFYKFSLRFRSNNKNGNIRLALKMFDEKNREILVCHHIHQPNSITEVTETAPYGSATLKIKDISHWNKNILNDCALAIDAKKDLSDLPNFKIVTLRISDIKQDNNGTILNLSLPLKSKLVAGTKVRQHYHGNANFNSYFMPLTTQWQKMNSYAEGIHFKTATRAHSFAPGSKKFSLSLYFFNLNGDQIIELKDIKITEE